MIRVLIVEDSAVAREFLAYVFGTDPALEVVGFAHNGDEAVAAAQRTHPDVITMDLHMPKLDGYDATRAIMRQVPTPVVIVSASTSVGEAPFMFRALEAGALAVALRPQAIGHPQHQSSVRELIQTVKLMSEIRVVRRIARSDGPPVAPAPVPPEVLHKPDPVQVIAIGASTGGPPALQRLLAELPKAFPAPILIVQHISRGFVSAFAAWLAEASGYPVQVAKNGQLALAGCAYVAPDGQHMGVVRGPVIALDDGPVENGLRPSVGHLFRSVAGAYGRRSAGVLLTGMGRDGAAELLEMREQGALTMAQDEATSVVHGMPGEAIRLGGATYVLSLEGIASLLTTLVAQTRGVIGERQSDRCRAGSGPDCRG